MTSAAYNDYLKSLSKDTSLQNGLAGGGMWISFK